MSPKNILQSFSASRRELLKRSSALAAGIAAASTLPRAAWAARENEMNIYCWEGYNSDKVLDPFRTEFNCEVKAQGLISDPDAVNQLRAGDTKIWDVINLNNSWGRRQLYPENLIVPVDQERFRPHWEMMLPEFKWPYTWAMSDDGKELLGNIQRFGPSGMLINTDVVSQATLEDEGYDLMLSDDFKGKYAILMYEDWVVMHAVQAAGFSPFRELNDDEIAKYETVVRKLINNASFLSDDMNAIALGIINGSIVGSFPGSVYTVSTARFDGNANLRCVVPKNGAAELAGKHGVCWMELTSLVNNPQLSPRGADFLEYVWRPEVAKNVSFAEGTFNPVAQMGDKRVMELFSTEELDAFQWDEMSELMSRCADFDTIPSYPKLHAIFSAAVRERQT
ncbi:MAG TPA: PotD/PotF family extracellular solute-binding protein [Geminicoccus sp.]|jgi:spermidine/putrescine transport system substrate-binding protein|uniref:ABC transporter substrate-binding protein n=1 Tax=Geminicoccus sp. TaxID=2024832 RepID=UPI002E33E24D|nr:PotD/PotF family extracellular solute-binding protein [Geminicoccus sp.]HEX2527196.1 PotD/PotF family extracellular solute-binding protein [Geminicoccus sp.]